MERLRSPCNLQSIAHRPKDLISFFSPCTENVMGEGMRKRTREREREEKSQHYAHYQASDACQKKYSGKLTSREDPLTCVHVRYCRQTDRGTDRQRHRQTDRQRDRQRESLVTQQSATGQSLLARHAGLIEQKIESVYQQRQRGREVEGKGREREEREQEEDQSEETDCQIAVWQSSVASGTVTNAAATSVVVGHHHQPTVTVHQSAAPRQPCRLATQARFTKHFFPQTLKPRCFLSLCFLEERRVPPPISNIFQQTKQIMEYFARGTTVVKEAELKLLCQSLSPGLDHSRRSSSLSPVVSEALRMTCRADRPVKEQGHRGGERKEASPQKITQLFSLQPDERGELASANHGEEMWRLERF
ncbi:unnamed protein product [Pleuronectes platessa]|uniref:Uncharacterized protein n=1 Tax=Pleuronectes platessa TaxID=8262 RepID=A0A9N7UB69_PLEPL|nr:unnamed protein product [Pleuronectes platessa]